MNTTRRSSSVQPSIDSAVGEIRGDFITDNDCAAGSGESCENHEPDVEGHLEDAPRICGGPHTRLPSPGVHSTARRSGARGQPSTERNFLMLYARLCANGFLFWIVATAVVPALLMVVSR